MDAVKKQVKDLLKSENSGHGYDHIERVYLLAKQFSINQDVDQELIELIALLHDVDDYKLVGSKNSETFYHAKRIMKECNVNVQKQQQVFEALQTIGYSKRLKGIVPQTLEAKTVSDADMCDAIGVHGILRTFQYSLNQGNVFFDRNRFPDEKMNYEKYVANKNDTSIEHIFIKLLKLKDLMLTPEGKIEAFKRHSIMVDMLYHYFEEEGANEWTNYLNQYLKAEDK